MGVVHERPIWPSDQNAVISYPPFIFSPVPRYYSINTDGSISALSDYEDRDEYVIPLLSTNKLTHMYKRYEFIMQSIHCYRVIFLIILYKEEGSRMWENKFANTYELAPSINDFQNKEKIFSTLSNLKTSLFRRGLSRRGLTYWGKSA